MSLASLFAEVKSQSRKKGLTLKSVLEDIDTKNVGKLSLLRFRRVFDILDIWVDEHKYAEITKIYLDNNKMVDCKQFLADYESNPEDSTSQITKKQLREFAGQFIARGTTLRQSIIEARKMRNNHVSVEGFLGVVGLSPLTRLIAKEYSNPPYFDELKLAKLEKDMADALAENPLTETAQLRIPKFFNEMAQNMTMKGIVPYQVFSAHDRLKRKTILPAHFFSDMSSLGLGLTHTELQELSDAFVEDGRFDYIAFCNAVDEANAINLAETQRKMKIVMETTAKEEPVDVIDALNCIKASVLERRLQLDAAFEHFDDTLSGKLPRAGFMNALAELRLKVNKREIEAICNEFEEDDKHVNYRTFILAVSPAPKSVESDIGNELDRLKTFLAEKKITLKPMMEKLDREQNGTITWNQLLSIFRNIGYDINQTERKILKAKTTNNVNIEEFCAMVDPVIEEKNEPENQEEDAEEEEDEIPEKEILDALARIASVVQRGDVDLKGDFRRYEPMKTGFIKRSTFTAVLNRLPVRPDESDIQALADAYTDNDKKMINAVKFIKHVDQYGTDQLKLAPELSITLTTECKPVDEEARKVIRKLKAHIASRGLNAQQLFRPYDQAGTGTVPKYRLRSIFAYIEFRATNEEVAKLGYIFESQKMPEQIIYKKLLTAMEAEEVTPDDLASSKVVRSVSNSGEYELINACLSIHSKLSSRRKTAGCVFTGLSDDPIPLGEFKERISNYGLVIPIAHIQAIIRKYRVNLRSDIDWKSFVTDVDTIKTVQPPR